ncbi:protein kinase, putative [Leishmania tarentolae]|uniref:Protein kinase, putative n=1 Tax=Leishmania tarentolae TaxID=5689 RepID=A0A640KGM9_LEITA|nr:protein kinase, putative [Leishmania tarentolae]
MQICLSTAGQCAQQHDDAHGQQAAVVGVSDDWSLFQRFFARYWHFPFYAVCIPCRCSSCCSARVPAGVLSFSCLICRPSVACPSSAAAIQVIGTPFHRPPGRCRPSPATLHAATLLLECDHTSILCNEYDPMEETSEKLLREPFQANLKRGRSSSYSTERGSPMSPHLGRLRPLPSSSSEGKGAAVSDSEEDPSARRHTTLELFELTPLGGSASTNVRAMRFGVEGLRIGRDPSFCDLVVSLNAVSRLHCVLSVLGDDVFVHDNSFNGTFINGRRVGRGRCSVLHPRDTLSFLNPTLEEASQCGFELTMLSGHSSSSVTAVEGLQRYELGPVLGQGSLAAVRLGIDRETGTPVAIKLIERGRLFYEEAAASLHTEIEMMRSMDHPHVVRVVDAFEGSGCVALVMEYVRGGDLFDYIVGRGRNPFTEAEARYLFGQLLEAILYVHRRSIIHCDLKPENVLVDVVRSSPNDQVGTSCGSEMETAQGLDSLVLKTDGDAALSVVDDHQAEAKAVSPYDVRLKVADFGSARYEGGGAGGTNVETTAAGTPVYAAPELVCIPADGASPQAITSAVDVWSLGVLLYILCSGTVPKPSRSNAVVAFNRSMTHLSALCKDLIARMMTGDATQRPSLFDVCHHPWLDGVTICGAPDNGTLGSEDVLSMTARLSPRCPEAPKRL